jgi:ABC-type bacteriocin/lantibiotic exporter with double-glycine peptidase domain
MSNSHKQISFKSAFVKLLSVVQLEKKEITAIYFYSILSGVIQLSLPLGIQTIINFSQAAAGNNKLPASIILLICIVLGGIFISGLLQVNQMKIVEKIEQSIFANYSLGFVNKIPKIDVAGVDKYHLPELMNRFFEVTNLQKGLSKILLDIPLALIQIIFGLILLSFYNTIFIVLGLLLFLVLFLIFKYTTQKGLIASYNESEDKYEVASWLEEIARSYKTFKISSLNNFHIKKADKLITNYLISKTKHFEILKFQYWSLVAFKVLISAIMLIIGAVLLVNQQLNIGQFIAAEIVIILILSAVEKLILNLETGYNILTGIEKLDSIISKKEEATGNIPFSKNSNGTIIDVKKLICQKEDGKILLNNIDFEIVSGQKICIVGDGGAGKSVLLEVIGGTIKNYSGTININNIPLNNLNQKEYRKNIGIFYHEQDIFGGTLFENICMGNENIDAATIMQTAKILGIDEFISQLPNGFETVLQPTGKGLSTIFAKKILLLRAIMNQPELILFDEPFELADNLSNQRIVDYIYELKNTTCVIATGHKPFAEKADMIIWLENGEIKQIGKPDIILPLLK